MARKPRLFFAGNARVNVLAFETATGRPGACLRTPAGRARGWLGERHPSPETVAAAADDLLQEAGLRATELDFVACTRGPGAFTGVRLGIALAQGFALGAECPAVGVSSLLALAWAAHREHGWTHVLALLDARQGEIYQGGYDFSASPPRERVTESLIKPEMLRIPDERWAVAGSGAALPGAASGARGDASLRADAAGVAELAAQAFAAGKAVAGAELAPVYLRNRVATPKSRSPV